MFIWRTTFCFAAPWRWKRKPAMVSQTENEWGGAISGAALRSRRLRLGHVHPCTLPRRFRLRPRATYFSPLPQSRYPAGARRSEFRRPGPAILPHVAGATRALPPLDRTYEDMRRYERRMSRLLIAFISSGLVFLLGPGSFLGLWNLFAISHQQTVQAVGPAWLQAHGHAEVHGWVGSFILGIGLHSLTRQTSTRVNFTAAWTCWALWTAGVAMRWCTGVTEDHWRVLLPLSAGLELGAFAIFQYLVSRAHRPKLPRDPAQPREKLPGWIFLVLTGALGFGLTLLVNLGGVLAALGAHAGPVLPAAWDGRLVELMAWAFLAPFVFGFSTRWL